MRRMRLSLNPSTALALIALFFALGGGAYAAIKLPANSVGTKQMKKNAVTLAKIAPSARARLRGATGPQGPIGPQGQQGSPGKDGNDGKDGAPGAPYQADSNGNVVVAASAQPGETNTIRIGTTQQTRAVVPAIYNSGEGADAVYIGSTGGLGRGVPSSRRFKTDIHPLRNVGARLMRLTPVSFKYRRGDRALRYGLIAEQVAKVLPALVISDSNGRPRALKMEQLPTLLLAQVEAQQRHIRDLERRIARLEQRGR